MGLKLGSNRMVNGMRPFFCVLIVGQVVGFMWLSDTSDVTSQGADPMKSDGTKPHAKTAIMTVWSAESPVGKTWGNDSRKVIDCSGEGCNGSGNALWLSFDGAGFRGCGLNWKGWYPADAGDDVSRFRSLVFYVRQVTRIERADLTIHLVDNVKRPQDRPVSNPLSVVGDGALSRIDGEWRKVVLPIERFARNTPLQLSKLWGINFSNQATERIEFQIDGISFSNDAPPQPRFPGSSSYSARATVEVNGATYPIRDEIYGACDMASAKVNEYAIPMMRYGGNRSSRHNWKINADNAGKDWFFKNGGRRVGSPEEGSYIKFALDQQRVGAAGYVTIPMLGFVSKDHNSYAYSVRRYGAQTGAEGGQPDVGNGILIGGRWIQGNNPDDTSIASTPEFIAEAVRTTVKHAGRAGDVKSGVRYWVLDNEPMLWHETHRDVRREPVGYEELWERTVQYAEAIKSADPSAKVAGFCSWGWTDLFFSAKDEGGDGYRTQADHRAHGRMPLAEWFIQKCGEYKKKTGRSLVDVFDFHWYPQGKVAGKTPYEGSGRDLRFNELRMRSTRDLWDADYQPESWTKDAAGGGPTRLIGRIREWIDRHNPGMELSLGEYNFGGADNVTGALAQVDAFGVLAREKVDMAFIWTVPEGSQESAWKLFRNYDGAGSRFGDRGLGVQSGNKDVGVYAATRSTDGAVTVVVVNRNLGGDCTFDLDLAGLSGTLRAFRIEQENPGIVAPLPKAGERVSGSIKVTLPAASATLFEIRK